MVSLWNFHFTFYCCFVFRRSPFCQQRRGVVPLLFRFPGSKYHHLWATAMGAPRRDPSIVFVCQSSQSSCFFRRGTEGKWFKMSLLHWSKRFWVRLLNPGSFSFWNLLTFIEHWKSSSLSNDIWKRKWSKWQWKTVEILLRSKFLLIGNITPRIKRRRYRLPLLVNAENGILRHLLVNVLAQI